MLRKNSAVDHQTLATRLHRLIEADHPATPAPAGKSVVFGEHLIGFAAKRQQIQLVTDTQSALLRLGYHIGVADGIVGSNTIRGIKAYQRAHQLRADGKGDAGALRAHEQGCGKRDQAVNETPTHM